MASSFAPNDKPDSTVPTSTTEAVKKAEESFGHDKEDTEETTSITEDSLTSLAQLSAQITSPKVGTSESKTKMTFTAKSIDNEGDVSQNHLLQDFQQLTLTKQDKNAWLLELKRTLEKLYAYLTLNGTQETY